MNLIFWKRNFGIGKGKINNKIVSLMSNGFYFNMILGKYFGNLMIKTIKN